MSSKSEAWIHFDKILQSMNVRCKLCKRECKRSDLSTRPLWSHLEHVHPVEWEQLKGNTTKKPETQVYKV